MQITETSILTKGFNNSILQFKSRQSLSPAIAVGHVNQLSVLFTALFTTVLTVQWYIYWLLQCTLLYYGLLIGPFYLLCSTKRFVQCTSRHRPVFVCSVSIFSWFFFTVTTTCVAISMQIRIIAVLNSFLKSSTLDMTPADT